MNNVEEFYRNFNGAESVGTISHVALFAGFAIFGLWFAYRERNRSVAVISGVSALIAAAAITWPV